MIAKLKNQLVVATLAQVSAGVVSKAKNLHAKKQGIIKINTFQVKVVDQKK